jgi:outer membrane immunogenic protein
VKKLLLASTILAGFASAASAADLRTAPAAIPAIAPMPTANWNGFYVGLHAGWLGAASNARMQNFTGGTDGFGFSRSLSGFNGGLYAGFNTTIQRIVLGVEADIGFGPGATVGGTTLRDFTTGGVQRNGFATRDGLNWNGHLRARLGFDMGQFMPYADQRIGHIADPQNLGATVFGTRNITRVGYSLGVGAEFMFTRNITGRLEYIYDDYGTTTFAINPDPNSAFAGATANVRSRLNTSTVRAGVGYRF